MLTKLLDGAITFVDLLKVSIGVVVLVILFVVFVGLPVLVSGESMKPNFSDKEIVVVSRFAYLANKEIKRGDVVAAKFPADPDKTRLIKRVIGLPGETVSVRDGGIFIDGAILNERYATLDGETPYDVINETRLRENEYFLVGDNRPGSSDSRLWGAVQKQDIQGKVIFVVFPIDQIRYVVNAQSS